MKTAIAFIFMSVFTSVTSFANFDLQSPEVIAKAQHQIEQEFSDAKTAESLSDEDKVWILNQYQHLDPQREVPRDLLEATVVYFELNKNKFPNKNYFSVINYKARSNRPRFFVINLASGVVEKYYTTHGWGSDFNGDGFATSFGNVNNSKKSSLGFARTAEVYSGKYKRSLRIDGLSVTNSNLRSRAIVVHGWDNVQEKAEIQGRTQGCPALDWNIKDGVIDKIHGGSLINMGLSVVSNSFN